MAAALTMTIKTREHRLTIGSLLDHMRQSKAFAQGHATTSTPTAFETAIEREIQDQSLYLASGRDVVRKITEDLRDFLLSRSKAESRKVVVPIDANIFLSTNATRRLTPESTDGAEQGSNPDGRAVDVEADKTDPMTTTAVTDAAARSGEVAVNETTLDLQGDDLSAILDGLNDANTPDNTDAGDVGAAMSSWARTIQADVEKLCNERGEELYRLALAINLQIRLKDETGDQPREYGRGRKWIGSYVKAKNRGKLEDQGATPLAEVRYFGQKMIMEGYFALGVLPELYADVLPSKHAQDLQSNMAALLAVMFLTDKPFLYATTIDHVADIITARASDDGCSEEGLSFLNSMGEYGNGICIAASASS